MKILVTGSNGFVGKNLISTLKTLNHDIVTFERDNSVSDLIDLTKNIDFVFHLAGANRPVTVEEFKTVNADLTQSLVDALTINENFVPIVLSSSIQAALDNDYGRSKLGGEEVLNNYSKLNNTPVYIYRFSNLFGKWSKPNYNTVVATWCYNISRDLPVTINDPSVVLNLTYIDDVIAELLNTLDGKTNQVESNLYTVDITYDKSLGEIHDLLVSFKNSRENLFIPNMTKGFETKLYSTYLSFIPLNDMSYKLLTHKDNRGSFTEFIKSNDRGQVSINISKPGITKGEHWHHSKNEKFLVVQGNGVIQMRDIFTDIVTNFQVSGSTLEVVDIPTGYTHNIINTGDTDMVTVMWVNEPFDPSHPDTFFEKVQE